MAESGQQETQGYTSREAIKRLLRAGIALVTLVAVGTIGYMRIEGWNFLDSLYMVYIIMSTIGFTEVRELDNAGRWWTALVGIGGIGTFAYAAGSLVGHPMCAPPSRKGSGPGGGDLLQTRFMRREPDNRRENAKTASPTRKRATIRRRLPAVRGGQQAATGRGARGFPVER